MLDGWEKTEVESVSSFETNHMLASKLELPTYNKCLPSALQAWYDEFLKICKFSCKIQSIWASSEMSNQHCSCITLCAQKIWYHSCKMSTFNFSTEYKVKRRRNVQITREKWAFNKQNVGNWRKDNTVCSFIRHFDVCLESIVCNSNQGRVPKFMCVWVVIKRLAVKHEN